jgi:hypothetical protein
MRCSSLAQVALSIFFLAQVAQSVTVTMQRRATTCNGHAELCDRSYGNISFVGAHDSYAVGVNNLATNQDYDLTQQLTDGVRLLQMQVHKMNDVIQLCHTSCPLFNGGPLKDYLGKVKTWMDANPNDVVSLLIVNSDNFPASAFDAVFKDAGLDTLSYAPTAAVVPASGWPTLGSMIDSGKRLVTFLDNGADFTAVPYLVDEFPNIWETKFNVIDTTFDCDVNRTKGDTATQMYLINHFLDKVVLGQPAPDRDRANVTNGVSGEGSLGLQVEKCSTINGRPPNFLLVDFYEYGNGSVFQVAANTNGVVYSPSKPIATPISEASAGASSGSGKGSASSIRVSREQLGASLLVATGILLGVLSVV